MTVVGYGRWFGKNPQPWRTFEGVSEVVQWFLRRRTAVRPRKRDLCGNWSLLRLECPTAAASVRGHHHAAIAGVGRRQAGLRKGRTLSYMSQ